MSAGSARALDQRHDIDAAGLQHGAAGQREFVQLQFGNAARDRRAGTGQETCAHAVGDGAQAQVEARRLNLAGGERIGGANSALFRQGRNHAVGQNSLLCRREGERHETTECIGPI